MIMPAGCMEMGVYRFIWLETMVALTEDADDDTVCSQCGEYQPRSNNVTRKTQTIRPTYYMIKLT